MPRRLRNCPPGLSVHVVQRGNNRQVCFAEEADLKACANWLREAAEKFEVAVHLVQSEQYLLACQRYIELNPVRAGVVGDPADYTWSPASATRCKPAWCWETSDSVRKWKY